MATKKKLAVRNLQISFKTQGGILKAVRGINFDLYQGETLAIVGESGSGKSVTSKAIIGILAGNSIVEGGEILYDGQDLLKIDEEHFHKIRGDKIAMIFQDPLSSLNPIMRVGKQLTEAMILNGKARQRNAKREFNYHLKLLKEHLDYVYEDKEKNASMCKTFDNFCIEANHLEKDYNTAQEAAISLKTKLEETIFLLEKKQDVPIKREIRFVLSHIKTSIHKFVLREDETIKGLEEEITELGKGSAKKIDQQKVIDSFSRLLNEITPAIDRKRPNYFRLGYYKMMNPEFDETSIESVDELDAMTLKYLEENFLNEFIDMGAEAEQYSRNVSEGKKRVLYDELKAFYKEVEAMESFDKKTLKTQLKKYIKQVEDAIDLLRTTKHSVEYSFGISAMHEYNRYFEGVKRNPINQRKYERAKAKHEALIAKGKSPSWQVVPPYIIDLELTKNNLLKIIDSVIVRYTKDLNKTNYDKKEEMVRLVNFFKEQASRLVYHVTQGIAKTRALELLKEVGIPEPIIRYRQYPFEFSGGMRQRIVIAIALSANPDILICDEPTTALDVTIQPQILELINKIKEERNLSVIFITHDLGVVANMADRIAVMYAGKIVEYGTADDVFYDPRHPYTWALLASMPDLETKEKLEAIPGTPPNMIYPPKGDAFAERNKYALEIDFEMEPPLFEISETHYAATWLLHPDAPKVEPPKIIQERIARMKKEAENLDE